jgi:hypothetical protein
MYLHIGLSDGYRLDDSRDICRGPRHPARRTNPPETNSLHLFYAGTPPSSNQNPGVPCAGGRGRHSVANSGLWHAKQPYARSMGILPMSSTGVSPVAAGPRPGRPCDSWAGRPCYESGRTATVFRPHPRAGVRLHSVGDRTDRSTNLPAVSLSNPARECRARTLALRSESSSPPNGGRSLVFGAPPQTPRFSALEPIAEGIWKARTKPSVDEREATPDARPGRKRTAGARHANHLLLAPKRKISGVRGQRPRQPARVRHMRRMGVLAVRNAAGFRAQPEMLAGKTRCHSLAARAKQSPTRGVEIASSLRSSQ